MPSHTKHAFAAADSLSRLQLIEDIKYPNVEFIHGCISSCSSGRISSDLVCFPSLASASRRLGLQTCSTPVFVSQGQQIVGETEETTEVASSQVGSTLEIQLVHFYPVQQMSPSGAADSLK
jgi:hypothetical protein